MDTATMGKAGSDRAQPQFALPIEASCSVGQQHLDQGATGQDTDSTFSSSTSPEPTLIETSDTPTPHALPTKLFIHGHDDTQAPIIEICSGEIGDLVLNIRSFGFGVGEEGPTPGAQNNMFTKGKPLARFRVSSVILKAASQYVKSCLDSTVSMPRTLNSGTKTTESFPTALPLLWVSRDDTQNLSLLIQSMGTMSTVFESSAAGMAQGGRKAFATLMRILHLTFDSRRNIKSKACDVGVMAAMVSELAYALGCVGPVVPWINLWLARDLPGNTTHWGLSAKKGHYAGIIVGYLMGDQTAFNRWSKMCIRYGRDSDYFAGLGFVWPLINHDLQTRRREYVEKLLTLLDQTWNKYYADQPTATIALAHSVALGALARAIHHHPGLDQHPPFVMINTAWQGSLDDLMLAFQDIKVRMDTVWGTFTAQHQYSKTIRFAPETPGDVFWKEATTIWVGISGLDLEDYRPGVEELLDVDGPLDNGIIWELEQDDYNTSTSPGTAGYTWTNEDASEW